MNDMNDKLTIYLHESYKKTAKFVQYDVNIHSDVIWLHKLCENFMMLKAVLNRVLMMNSLLILQ